MAYPRNPTVEHRLRQTRQARRDMESLARSWAADSARLRVAVEVMADFIERMEIADIVAAIEARTMVRWAKEALEGSDEVAS